MKAKRRWTPAELDILRREYPKRATSDVALFVNRPKASVTQKAAKLGLRKKSRATVFAPWMVEMLKKHYPDTRTALLAEWLGISKKVIERKAKELGVKKEGRLGRTYRTGAGGGGRTITPADEAYIREHVGHETVKAIAAHLGFTSGAISAWCTRKGVSRFWAREGGPTSKMRLTAFGEDYLRKRFGNAKNDDLARKMRVSPSTLHRFARQLGLSKTAGFIAARQMETTMAAREANRRNRWPPKGYRIPGREKGGFRKGENNLQRLGAEREAERIRKLTESRRRLQEEEAARVAAGLPQKTRLRIGRQPVGTVRLRWYLKKRGYIIDEAARVAYWTDETHRATRLEAREGQYYKYRKLES